jgi:hypothetical protein
MVVDPGPDLLHLLQASQIDLVEDHHVRKCDLAKLESHQVGKLGMSKDLVRVHHASDAVQPNALPQPRVNERHGNTGRIGDATGFDGDRDTPGSRIYAEFADHSLPGMPLSMTPGSSIIVMVCFRTAAARS